MIVVDFADTAAARTRHQPTPQPSHGLTEPSVSFRDESNESTCSFEYISTVFDYFKCTLVAVPEVNTPNKTNAFIIRFFK